jgi:hypothetical protein
MCTRTEVFCSLYANEPTTQSSASPSMHILIREAARWADASHRWESHTLKYAFSNWVPLARKHTNVQRRAGAQVIHQDIASSSLRTPLHVAQAHPECWRMPYSAGVARFAPCMSSNTASACVLSATVCKAEIARSVGTAATRLLECSTKRRTAIPCLQVLSTWFVRPSTRDARRMHEQAIRACIHAQAHAWTSMHTHASMQPRAHVSFT